MKIKVAILLTCLTSIVFSSCKKKKYDLYTLKTEIIHSDTVDDEYQIYILLPSDYTPTKSYPVIYFLDGNWYIDFFEKEINSLVASNQIEQCIIVGVGYPIDGGYKELCPHCTDEEDDIVIPRFRDLTYPTVDTWTIPTGEGDKFASFLNEELIPKIESEYSIDTTREFLMGHSLGGLSMFYNMFIYPNSKFDGYASLSASLYWGEGYTLRMEEEYFENNADLNTTFYMAYGSAESGSLAVHNEEMMERINNRNYPSLNFKTEVFIGASHRQVSWEGFSNATQFLLNQ